MKSWGLIAESWSPVFAQIDLKNAVIKIKDGSTPAEELEVKIGEGNLTYTEAKTIEYTLDRGTIDEVREGDQVPMDVRMDFVWEYLKGPSGSGTTPTVEDALKQRGPAAAWVSTDADTCRPYAVDLEILYEPVPASCGDRETITLPDFRYESLDHDLRAGTVACAGRCNAVEAAVVRDSQSD